jgi:hypothetical protein
MLSIHRNRVNVILGIFTRNRKRDWQLVQKKVKLYKIKQNTNKQTNKIKNQRVNKVATQHSTICQNNTQQSNLKLVAETISSSHNFCFICLESEDETGLRIMKS